MTLNEYALLNHAKLHNVYHKGKQKEMIDKAYESIT